MEASHGKVTVSKGRVSPGEAVTLSVTPDKGYVLETLVVTDALGRALPLTPLGGQIFLIMPGFRSDDQGGLSERSRRAGLLRGRVG